MTLDDAPLPVDRQDPPPTGDETTLLRAYLTYHRDTLRRKTAGLADADLHRTLPPSTITLGSLLSHLAFVEDYWFGYVLQGRQPVEPWISLLWDEDEDADWHIATRLDGAGLRALHDDAVAASDAAVDQALSAADGQGLDALAARDTRGQRVSLRWILLHMVEEYARHNGHADLVRESVDGATGE